jgi:hypothetical protein
MEFLVRPGLGGAANLDKLRHSREVDLAAASKQMVAAQAALRDQMIR